MAKIIPFRRRQASSQELEVFRWIPRSWSPALRQLMCPQYFPFAAQPVRLKAPAKPPGKTRR
jgi:hypothetical protein